MIELKLKGEIWPGEMMDTLCEELETAPEDVTLTINSPGGDVMTAYQVVNAIKKCGHKVKARVEVEAASAAAVIALACDGIEIDKNGLLMLHHCWTLVVGNKEDLKEEMEAMKAIDTVMENIITEHAKDPEGLKAELEAGDVWMTGDEVAECFDNVTVVEIDRADFEDKFAASAYAGAAMAKLVASFHAQRKEIDGLKAELAKRPEPKPEYKVAPALKALLDVELG